MHHHDEPAAERHPTADPDAGGATADHGGRTSRRAARRAARLAAGAASGAVAARRGARLLRLTGRLARGGALLAIVGGVVWWAVQRSRTRDAGLSGPVPPRLAGPELAGGGTIGGGVPVDRQRAGGPAGDDPVSGKATGERILDLREAAEVLEVEPARIPVMVEGGLLRPVGGTDDQLRFHAAEVEAVRLQGG